jgi:CHASE2 domain-containing sensor protein
MLEELLGLPAALTRTAGLILIPFVAFVLYVGAREPQVRGAVWTIALANFAWAAASIALLLSGWVAPTMPGYAFVVAQAVVVAILGELQYAGLKRSAAVV